MIQLTSAPRPAKMTADFVEKQTARFLTDKSQRVWASKFIVEALRAMSSNKCCYCERDIPASGGYMEVEHFFAKNLYPNWVLWWENLLPSCRPCNNSKHDHDCLHFPIIHPVVENPREHLEYRAYRFYPKTEIGRTTIRVLGLNRVVSYQQNRFEIGSKVKADLDKMEADFRRHLERPDEQILREILEKLKGRMWEGQPQKEYAATVATEILHEESYHFVKNELQKLGRWDLDFETLETGLQQIAFL